MLPHCSAYPKRLLHQHTAFLLIAFPPTCSLGPFWLRPSMLPHDTLSALFAVSLLTLSRPLRLRHLQVFAFTPCHSAFSSPHLPTLSIHRLLTWILVPKPFQPRPLSPTNISRLTHEERHPGRVQAQITVLRIEVFRQVQMNVLLGLGVTIGYTTLNGGYGGSGRADRCWLNVNMYRGYSRRGR